jgi:predicted metalloprotease
MTDDDRSPSVDGPTAMSPTSGQLNGGHPGEPTLPGPAPLTDDPDELAVDGPTVVEFSEPIVGGGDQPHEPPPSGPTVQLPIDEPTAIEPAVPAPPGDAAAGGVFWSEDQDVPGDDEPTLAVVSDDPTTTGPTVGGWPFDQFEPPPPGELVWQPEAPPVPAAARRPAYYVTLGAAVVLVVAFVGLAAVVTVLRPRQEVAGDASAAVPAITESSQAPPAPTTQPAPTSQAGPLADLAAHPLSSSTTRMPDTTCALPRFDPADDRQAAFFEAARTCAVDAWRPVLQQAGLTAEVKVVTLTAPVQTQTCGELTPTSPATECDGTVYLTPAYLRDTEQNGRYPGRYLGVFLREYARAVQYATGLDDLVGKVTTGSAADLDTRVDQQATCLAGVVGGSMAGRGAIDDNITGEIQTRLSSVDAPADARSWLDKGFQQRTPAACNSWS